MPRSPNSCGHAKKHAIITLAAAAAYERRMRIEELFRDQKNVRNGWALRQVEIGKTDRLERLLLIQEACL